MDEVDKNGVLKYPKYVIHKKSYPKNYLSMLFPFHLYLKSTSTLIHLNDLSKKHNDKYDRFIKNV